MAGQVQHQQIIRLAVGEKALDLLLDQLSGLVHQRAHVEAADRWVGQHPPERLHIMAWRPQLPKRLVAVGGRGHQQRRLAARHRAHRPA